MAKFDFDNQVRVSATAPEDTRPGAHAWIVGVFEQRPAGSHFAQFPPGVVYSIEFEDGVAIDIHESHLEHLQ